MFISKVFNMITYLKEVLDTYHLNTAVLQEMLKYPNNAAILSLIWLEKSTKFLVGLRHLPKQLAEQYQEVAIRFVVPSVVHLNHSNLKDHVNKFVMRQWKLLIVKVLPLKIKVIEKVLVILLYLLQKIIVYYRSLNFEQNSTNLLQNLDQIKTNLLSNLI